MKIPAAGENEYLQLLIRNKKSLLREEAAIRTEIASDAWYSERKPLVILVVMIVVANVVAESSGNIRRQPLTDTII
ncbi:MAG: hypothetical protein CMJ46_07560 [Planctomyces sp.]|nr:hypothetical protein [Planctomyces sp.]